MRCSSRIGEDDIDDSKGLADQLHGLVEEALSRANMADSYFHGQTHWRRVALIGLHLLDSVDGADPLVLFLFALFHDSMRENEDRDPGHGTRGRVLGMELIPKHLDTSEEQLAAFKFACDNHHTGAGRKTRSDPTIAGGKISSDSIIASGHTTGDPTIGVCWDSDRLDRWRVGSKPRPEFMSTPLARKAEIIHWTETLLDNEPPEWTELAEEVADTVMRSQT